MELTNADWRLLKFLVIEKEVELLPKVLEALESGLHFVDVKKRGNHIEFIFT